MYGVYSSCKAAIVNLGQALSEELRSDRININIINPQRTATPMRYKNFGNEPKHSLLDPRIVALSTLHTLLSDLNGQIIDVRLDGEVGGGSQVTTKIHCHYEILYASFLYFRNCA